MGFLKSADGALHCCTVELVVIDERLKQPGCLHKPDVSERESKIRRNITNTYLSSKKIVDGVGARNSRDGALPDSQRHSRTKSIRCNTGPISNDITVKSRSRDTRRR